MGSRKPRAEAGGPSQQHQWHQRGPLPRVSAAGGDAWAARSEPPEAEKAGVGGAGPPSAGPGRAGRPLSPLGPRLLLPLAAATGEPRGTAPALGGPHHALSHHPVPEALLTAASHLVRKGHTEGGGRTGQGRAAGGLVQLDTALGRQSRQLPAAGSQIPTGASGLETLVTAPQVDGWQQEAPWAQQTGGRGRQESCLPPWTDPTGAWHTRPHLTGW